MDNGLCHGLTDANGCRLVGRVSTREGGEEKDEFRRMKDEWREGNLRAGGCQWILSRMPFGWARFHAWGIYRRWSPDPRRLVSTREGGWGYNHSLDSSINSGIITT